ncbi:MAG: DUF2069 domain-containing protein [Burkholderiales bacterium]|nr:DUF2069 domain-containing protein [Burkholderiales bacterium]
MNAPAAPAPRAARLALAGLVALTLVALLWEWLLAPLRPGGSWLVLKAVPLAALVPAALRGARRGMQVLSLLLPFYVAEGVVRGLSEAGRHALVAWTSALIAAATFVALLAWLRAARAGPGRPR